jgi:hypothetical protein
VSRISRAALAACLKSFSNYRMMFLLFGNISTIQSSTFAPLIVRNQCESIWSKSRTALAIEFVHAFRMRGNLLRRIMN